MVDKDGQSLALGELLKNDTDEDRKDRILSRIVARRQVARPAGRPLRVSLAVATAVAVCGIALGLVWRSAEPQAPTNDGAPLRIRGGAAFDRLEVPEAASLSATFQLSDGSSIELAPGGSLSTTENDGERASIVLVNGDATFDIAPSRRQWTIDAGLASIEVLGTRFRVHRTSQEVEVTVERGTVRLRSEHFDEVQRLLRRGETVTIETRPTTDETEGADEQVIEPDRETPTQEPADDIEPVAPSSMPWEALARRGQFDEAYGRLGSRGLSTQTNRARSIEELLLLADVARLSGHPREAVAPLEQAIAQYGGHRRAAVAAFTLGRLQADVLSNLNGAVDAFERCLALGPPAALHADALARLAEARERTGDREGARAAAREYLERYPEGQRAGFLGTLVER